MSYQIPTDIFEHEYGVKKSRFIARVVPVDSRKAANAAVEKARRDYPDARHHCWAYLLGKPADASNAGMNDDGEPAGTAGKPILNVLQHGHVGDILVIVIRYFGGIKLGAGGLVRAYGTATRLALDLAPTSTRRECRLLRVRGEFSCEQVLRHWLDSRHGEVENVEYGEQISMNLAMPLEEIDALRGFCAANRMRLEEVDSLADSVKSPPK